MYKHCAYGIGLHSALPLPELRPGEFGADVVIRLAKLDRAPVEVELLDHYSWTSGADVYLYWKDVATFLIRDGKEIIIDAVPGLEERRLRLFLLGAAMAVLLHQRGFLVLHASAVVVNGDGVVFLGGKGWGKSTMAATLLARGHGYLADDVVALSFGHGIGPLITPAFPQLKLWPDAVTSLGGDPDLLPLVSSLIEKRDSRVMSGFVQEPVPLKYIYVLGLATTDQPEITPLQPQDAIRQLIVNSYAARFGNLLLKSRDGKHLSQCADLINNVSICRLNRPNSLDLLPAIAQLVETHQDHGAYIFASSDSKNAAVTSLQ
jgi:hypothetical protein